MRNNIVYKGADELTYEIREVVEVARKVESFGVPIVWENIGDPIAKGQEVDQWIKDIISNAVENDNSTFGYSPTRGVLETRKYLATVRNKEGGAQISPDNILFYNGLGDAISNIYSYLNSHSRVIGPDPAYPTHSSAEAAHNGSAHITYKLNPKRNWLPDLDDLRNKIKYNPTISGILIINPDNPTGLVYPKKILEEIVSIARQYDLFIVADEIYGDLVFKGEKMVPLSSVIDGVPAIAMKGLSKEVPWPGARCGWVEFYNSEKDPVFARYVKTLIDAKMLEVCSTTLPQKVLPTILSDSRYKEHVSELGVRYEKRANIVYEYFKDFEGIIAPKPSGTFYYSIIFDDGVLTGEQVLEMENSSLKNYIEDKVKGVELDKRFVYYLLGATGICVVPMSGMNSKLLGFRMTLLEQDDEKFLNTVRVMKDSIEKYLLLKGSL